MAITACCILHDICEESRGAKPPMNEEPDMNGLHSLPRAYLSKLQLDRQQPSSKASRNAIKYFLFKTLKDWYTLHFGYIAYTTYYLYIAYST